MKRGALAIWVFILAVIAVFSVLWMPREMPLIDRLPMRLLLPFKEGGIYALGADESGRSLLLQVLKGTGISLRISVLSVLISFGLGVPMGLLAAWRKGWWERGFLFLADCFQAFPGMLLAIALAAFIPASTLNLILILGLMGWVGFARLARAQGLSLREREFMLATRTLGLPIWRIFFFHLIPNVIRPLVVQASFALAGVILAEATLSFLGLGLPPQIPSLGRMMDAGVRYLLLTPHLAVIPGLAIFSLVLTFNLLGDSLADHLDPRSS